MDGTFWFAIVLTTFAGLSTTLGSLIAIFYNKPSPSYMAFTMGFSAGVMIFVSFAELLPLAVETIGFGYSNFAFFIGMIAILIIDFLLPHSYILEECKSQNDSKPDLRKTAIFVAFGIAIHNFPEGIATFAGVMKDVNIGISLAIAIAIHNIPEGIAVAVPVFISTGSRKKAFLWSFLSGVSEPMGALIAGLILMPILNDVLLSWILAGVAGIMVFISFDELLPVSQSYGREHISIIGVISGMIIMAVSLALF
ncbi:zinc transporter ZupT [candidate division KSB1 bacterium]